MVSVVGRVLTGLAALSPLACARLTLRCLLRLTGKRKAGEDTENGGQNAPDRKAMKTAVPYSFGAIV